MKKTNNPGFFPLLVNLNKFPCLVIGGGKVAHRKVLSLQKFNAFITVISPKFCKPLTELAKTNKIKIIKKSYSKAYIKNFKIVFCTTDNSLINKKVREDCSDLGILLNVADNPAMCDFILPANIKRGDLTVSISSQGKAPFYVKEMKEKLNDFISPVQTDIIDLASEFRNQLLKNKKITSVKTKTKLFHKFTSMDWESILKNNGKHNSKHYIREILKEFNLT